ncbi:hypothetical protein F5884DRAFT_823394 [Xylogone sp. PMI_703]|nr:hypothetical protein F5884DRAFT_823394 [Xylogone sp. PMI_703]
MMADVPRRKPMPPGFQPQPVPQAFNHSRTRTTSSGTFNPAYYPPQQQQYQSNIQINTYSSRRTPSTNTFASGSSGNGPVPNRQSSTDLRRSISSRSGGASSQPSSYVALMRRQKATVWCERAQHEDPRLVAAQKAAKLRATLEVIGGPRTSTISSTSGGKSKIRHGKATLIGYTPGDLVGGVGGVPMRLSASEVEGGDSDDETGSAQLYHHRRTGSGRSSISSGRRAPTYSRHSAASSVLGRRSSGNTPPGERERQNSMSDLIESGETPVPGHNPGPDYFPTSGGDGTRSVGSGSSAERADDVPELTAAEDKKLATKTITREKSLRNPEDLRRRGSVDERTMTLTAGRLYIANPDESD